MIRLALLLFLLGSQVAFAQAAKIRSGEHEGFSRLVITLPASNLWQFDQVGDGYRFSVPGWDQGFDTSEVFQLIPRTRLAGLKTDESSVTLELACDCDALAASYVGSYVIIDIADRTFQTRQVTMDDAVRSVMAHGKLQTPPQTENRLSEDAVSRVRSIGLANVADAQDASPADLNPAQKKLLEGLSRAAGLDLLRTSPALGQPEAVAVDEPIVEAELPAKEEGFATPIDIPVARRAEERFRIRSAVDVARGDTDPNAGSVDQYCASDEDWKIAAWGNGLPYTDQLAALRGRIVEDISQVNLSAARDLVRLYLHFGLGAEAVQASRSFDLAPRDVEIANLIAAVLDGRPTRPEIVPQNALECGANQGMWHILAYPSQFELKDTQTEALTSLFLSFPAHLKKMLGPKLILALNQRGNSLTGKVLYSAISNAQQRQDNEVYLSATSTIEDLQEIIARNDETAPEAMVTYLRAMRDGSRTATQQDIVLAEAFRRQLENTPVATALSKELLRTYSFAGQFPEALSLVAEIPEKDAGPAINEIVSDLARHQEKLPVVEATISLFETDYLLFVGPDPLRNLAVKLHEIGIPSLTRRLIELTETQDMLAPILIRSLIEEEQFTQADRALRTYDGEDRLDLVSLLELRRGRAETLDQATIENLPEERRNQLAWLSGNHDLILAENARKAAASHLLDDFEKEDSEPSLAAMSARIERSARTREIISNLLKEVN